MQGKLIVWDFSQRFQQIATWLAWSGHVHLLFKLQIMPILSSPIHVLIHLTDKKKRKTMQKVCYNRFKAVIICLNFKINLCTSCCFKSTLSCTIHFFGEKRRSCCYTKQAMFTFECTGMNKLIVCINNTLSREL